MGKSRAARDTAMSLMVNRPAILPAGTGNPTPITIAKPGPTGSRRFSPLPRNPRSKSALSRCPISARTPINSYTRTFASLRLSKIGPRRSASIRARCAKLWTTGSSGQTVYQKLASLLPAGYNIKDVTASLLRHWPTLDFAYATYLRNNLWTTADEKAEYEYRTGSYLVPEADQSGWYSVPYELCRKNTPTCITN